MYNVTVYTADGNVLHGVADSKDCAWLNGGVHYEINLQDGVMVVPVNKLICVLVTAQTEKTA